MNNSEQTNGSFQAFCRFEPCQALRPPAAGAGAGSQPPTYTYTAPQQPGEAVVMFKNNQQKMVHMETMQPPEESSAGPEGPGP